MADIILGNKSELSYMRINIPVTQNEYSKPEDATIISRTDKLGIITWCNDTFVEASGFTRTELIGQPHNIVRHPDMPSALFADLWSSMQSNLSWLGVLKNRRKNGDFYWVRAMVTPLPDGSGYSSVRIKPSQQEVCAAQSLYSRLKAEESN
jgi:aerotaxis receptor